MKHFIQSPAKINLMLRILGQRPDGYHNLQTLFQILDWGDDIEFSEIAGQGSHEVTIEGFSGLLEQDNLIYRAASKLKPFAQKKTDWHIKVTKRIPQGAGLGGGSSNAAQTLKFLNRQWDCGLDVSQLSQIGAQLGADVPVFIQGESALACGTGERVTTMAFDTSYILLLFPNLSISTAEMFRHKELNRNQCEVPFKQIHNSNFWINDFFPLLLKTNQEIRDLYNNFKNHALFRLSGTGSTLFALFQSREAAERVQKKLQNRVDSKLVKPKI